MSTLNFNVAGDPKNDQPTLIADNPPGGTTLASHFEGGSPPNRFVATVAGDITGGATLSYQNGAKKFRVILPPGDGPWEAGLPPCLPPEYEGDSEQVAMKYGAMGRTGIVRLDRNVWTDDGGPFRPTGAPQFYAIGGWWRGLADQVRDNFRYIFENGGNVVRLLGQVDWAGESIDPSWPNYQDVLDAVLSAAHTAGLRVHFTVTGGSRGQIDPVAAARIMLPVLQAHREHLLCIESINEGNGSVKQAIQIAQMMRLVGVPVAVGLGNQGLETINWATSQSGANVGILHEERSTDVARNIRQCWDFRLLEGAPACSEPQGPASSVAEETVAFNLAAARFARIICGAGYFLQHEGHGVFGRTYPYHATTPSGEPHSDTRFARFDQVPSNAEYFRAVGNAESHLPIGCENWAKFNTNQPVVVPANNVNKIYGCRDGGRFAEVVIGAIGAVTLRADQPCQLKVVNPATAEVLVERHLAQGEQTTVGGLTAYGLVGAIR